MADDRIPYTITFSDEAFDGFVNFVTSFKGSRVRLTLEDRTMVEGEVMNVSVQGGTIDIGPLTFDLGMVRKVHYF